MTPPTPAHAIVGAALVWIVLVAIGRHFMWRPFSQTWRTKR